MPGDTGASGEPQASGRNHRVPKIFHTRECVEDAFDALLVDGNLLICNGRRGWGLSESFMAWVKNTYRRSPAYEAMTGPDGDFLPVTIARLVGVEILCRLSQPKRGVYPPWCRDNLIVSWGWERVQHWGLLWSLDQQRRRILTISAIGFNFYQVRRLEPS